MINLYAVNRQIHNSLLFLSPFIPPFACFLCTSVISDDVGSDGRRKFNASEHWACASSGPESQEDDSPDAGQSNERSAAFGSRPHLHFYPTRLTFEALCGSADKREGFNRREKKNTQQGDGRFICVFHFL